MPHLTVALAQVWPIPFLLIPRSKLPPALPAVIWELRNWWGSDEKGEEGDKCRKGNSARGPL
eukprot:16189027-Heterocapsa_arctica.AAC.1